MKKIMLLLAIAFAATTFASAQNEELMNWVNKERKAANRQESPKPSKEKEEDKLIRKTSYFGMGIGYTSGGYLPINFHYTYKKVYYGFSVAFPLSKGTKGELYTVINWDENSEDHVKEGSYYTPITFDMGYDFNDFTIGAGAGIAVGTKYRNCFDNYHILGNNGSYYKEVSNGTTGEFKIFAKYRFYSQTGIHCYLSAQYTIRTGIGATIGFDI